MGPSGYCDDRTSRKSEVRGARFTVVAQTVSSTTVGRPDELKRQTSVTL